MRNTLYKSTVLSAVALAGIAFIGMGVQPAAAQAVTSVTAPPPPPGYETVVDVGPVTAEIGEVGISELQDQCETQATTICAAHGGVKDWDLVDWSQNGDTYTGQCAIQCNAP